MTAHRARKRFGQNFLVAADIIDAIIAAIAPRRDDLLVEIGPGLGALTAPLLQKLAHLHVIEIDRDLVAHLQQRFNGAALSVHPADALDFDFTALAGEQPLHVVGNLPYNISTPLLFHLVAHRAVIARMHFMLQREVAARLAAAPGGGDYGRLSVMLQYHFDIEMLIDVPASCFEPAPKVASSVVQLSARRRSEQESAVDLALFSRLVAAAFAQRRKMLRNTLKSFGGESLLAAVGIDPTARAENLAVADYVRLCNHLAASS